MSSRQSRPVTATVAAVLVAVAVMGSAPAEGVLVFDGKGVAMYKLTCCVAVAVAGLGGQAVADILNVPADFPTIQAAINAAISGDQVVVADGVYTGAGNKNLEEMRQRFVGRFMYTFLFDDTAKEVV